MLSAVHPEFGPVAILAALSLLLPLPWHWRAGNVATLSIIGWLFISNLIYAVDAFVWGNNVDIIIPVWCDITTKLIIGANVALPAACLCICIHLEQVASLRRARTTFTERRQRQLFEAGMCLGLPLILMVLHYIVQGHRFDIIEGYGCRPAVYFSIPAIFIVWVPSILVSAIAIIFAGLALRHFVLRRLSFAAHLDASTSALTTSRYLRLMTMAALQMVWSITVSSYALWFNTISEPLRPWTTWADVHSDWDRIDLFPALFTPPLVAEAFYILWWLVPVSTLCFVMFFSFGKDAMDEYSKFFAWFRVKVFRYSSTAKSSKGAFSIIPLSRTKPVPELPISSPKSISDSDVTVSSLPAYSPKKFHESLKDFGSDTHSEVTTHYASPPYGESKAIGPYTDLTLQTPTTIGSFTAGSPRTLEIEPKPSISPLTPPPTHPRLRALMLPSSPPSTRNSPRPITYPSFDLSHCAIHPFRPEP